MEQPPQNSADSRDKRLDALFRVYRQAIPDPEPGASFMPHLWARIEKAQAAAFGFRRIARSFVTAAAMLSVVLGMIAVIPAKRIASPYAASYVETLADNRDLEHIEYSEAPNSDSTPDTDDMDLI
jgi:hypothetical protein